MDLNDLRRKFREKKEQKKKTNSYVPDFNDSTVVDSTDIHQDLKSIKSGEYSTISLSDLSYNYERGTNIVSFSCSAIYNTSDYSTGLLSLCCWISEKTRENDNWQNENYTLVDSIELCSLKKGNSVSDINKTFDIPDNLLAAIDRMNEEGDEWHFVFTINELHEDGYNYIIYTINGPDENEGIKLPIQDDSLTILIDNDNKIRAFIDDQYFSGILVSSDERFEMKFKKSTVVFLLGYHKNGEIGVCGNLEEPDSSLVYYDENGNEIKEHIFKSRYGPDFEKIIGTGFEEIISKYQHTLNENVNNQSNKTSFDVDSSVFSKVKSIVIEKLGVEPYEVVESASFMNDLGADSLDAVELIMEFEKEYSISIPDKQAERIRTVGDAVRYIESHR